MIQGPTAQGYLGEAINRDGMVAGRWVGGGPMTIWQPGSDGEHIDLRWVEPKVHDLNDLGQVLGIGYGQISNNRVGWVWQDGDASRVPGTGVKRQGWPRAMNNNGVIVGHVRSDTGTHATVWRSPSSPPELLEVPGGYTSSRAESINERGVITGRAWNEDSEIFVRWRGDFARSIDSPDVDSPDVDTVEHVIALVKGKYFAGYSFTRHSRTRVSA